MSIRLIPEARDEIIAYYGSLEACSKAKFKPDFFRSLIGKKFSHLTLVKYTTWNDGSGNNKNGFLCRCDCGNYTEHLRWSDIKSGHTKSCGHCSYSNKGRKKRMKNKKVTQEMLDSMSEEELRNLTDKELAELVGLKIGRHTLLAYVPVFTCSWGKKKKGFITDKSGKNIAQWSNLYRLIIRKQNKSKALVQPDLTEEPEQSALSEDSDIHVVKTSSIQKYKGIVESDDTENTALLIIPVKQSLIKILEKIAEDNSMECIALARAAIINMAKEYEKEAKSEEA